LTNLSHGIAGGNDAKKLAEQYKKDFEGNDRILREVRNIQK
jgi:ribosomal protein S17E